MSELRDFSRPEIDKIFHSMASSIVERYSKETAFFLVGLANGGVAAAHELQVKLQELSDKPVEMGVVDISFYRDDFGSKPITSIKYPTDIPFDLDQVSLILVDDVIESGRSIRAAMGEIFDQGRPRQVELAVLIDRNNRKLPIQPDYTGCQLSLENNERLRVMANEAGTAIESIIIEKTDHE